MLAWIFPNQLLFRPPNPSYTEAFGIIHVPTRSGKEIACKLYENPDAQYTILFSHGNAEDIGTIAPFNRRLRDSGFAVFTYDYQGYGLSEGSPSVEAAYEDIQAAYKYLTEGRGLAPDRIIIHGRSLGGGPSVELASRESVGGLILESTFTSASRVLIDAPIFPIDAFENITKIGSVKCPVLIVHGKQDRTISFTHAEQLFAAANEPKGTFWVDDAGHNNLFALAATSYLNAIGEFANGLPNKKAGLHR
jgi:fermentation-respiration switch protein FrsA (DUF1100 family)